MRHSVWGVSYRSGFEATPSDSLPRGCGCCEFAGVLFEGWFQGVSCRYGRRPPFFGQKWCDQTAARWGKKWPGYRETPTAPNSLTRNVESTEEGPQALSFSPGATEISEEAVLCGGL